MDEGVEIDPRTAALLAEGARRHGFKDVESYLWALLEKDIAMGTGPEAQAFHAKLRHMMAEGEKDHSGN